MFNSKNRRMMRHPYATLAVLSLAVAGAISITQKGKKLIKEKGESVKNMFNKMKAE